MKPTSAPRLLLLFFVSSRLRGELHAASRILLLLLFVSSCLRGELPAATPIKDLKVLGTSQQASGTFTLQTGVVWTAAAGSTVDLSAATLTLATGQLAWDKVAKTGSSLADLATRSAADLTSGTLPDARFPATLPALNGSLLTALTAANLVFADGARITFNPNATNAGLNVGAHTADPSAPINGDLWYDSTANALEARINGATVALGAGGGGSGTFIGLTDVPAAFTGAGGKLVGVNAGATALEFVSPAAGGVTDFTDLADAPASYTGQGGKTVAVKADATGLEFITGGGGSFTWSSVPASNVAAGTAGDLAYDSSYLYVAVATNTWRRAALSTPFITSPAVLTYASDGDANGVCYFAGGNFSGSGGWTNPHTAGYLTVVHSPLADGSTPDFVDHTGNVGTATTDAANSFVGIDLGSGRMLTPNHYSLRMRSVNTDYAPRNWKFQGTNSVSANTEAGFNAASWTDLDTQTSNSTINTAGGWFSGAVSGAGAFRYLRIIQTGPNSLGFNHFMIAEIEFYGTLAF